MFHLPPVEVCGMGSQPRILIRAIFAAALALPASTASAGTFYVDARKGYDANAGSLDAPWKTIQKAADSLQPGDIVLVAAGKYPERVHITHSGAPDRPITYQAEGETVMEGFSVTANYIRVVGFEITSHVRLYRESYGIYVHGQHNEILNNYIHDIYHDGIMLSGEGDPNSPLTSFNLVKGNRICRASSSGITVEGRQSLIEANDISHIIQYPPGGPVFDGADADGLRPFGTGHILRNNRVHDIRGSELGNLDPHIDCIETWGPASHILFEQNVCDADDGDFMVVQGAQIENSSGPVSQVTFRNNIFMNVRVGIHVEEADHTNIRAVHIVNNTFHRITHHGVLLEGLPHVAVENNAFYDVGSHQDSYLGLSAGSVVSNRGSYLNSGSKEGLVVGYNSQSMSDGRAPGSHGSQAPYPHDLCMADPRFVNAAAKDFRLQPNSPLVDAGVTLEDVPTDFVRVPRPQGSGYDIGAYELQR